MTKKQLQEYYWLKRNINQLEDRLLELETQATKITSTITDEPKNSSSNGDKISNIVIKIIDVKYKINSQLQRSYQILEEIENTIEKLPERERYLMRSKYIEGKTWEQIAVDMNYSWMHIHRIHSKALKMI